MCALVQGAAFVTALAASADAPARSGWMDPALMGAVAAVQTIALPFAGLANANRLSALLERAAAGGGPMFAVAGCFALLLTVLTLAQLRGLRGRIAVCYGLVLVPSLLFAAGSGLATDPARLLTPMFAERYFYVPSMMLAVLAITVAAESDDHPTLRTRLRRGVAAALVVSSIAFGALDFRSTIRPYTSAAWPTWRDEVAAWRADTNRKVRVWPPQFEVRPPR